MAVGQPLLTGQQLHAWFKQCMYLYSKQTLPTWSELEQAHQRGWSRLAEHLNGAGIAAPPPTGATDFNTIEDYIGIIIREWSQQAKQRLYTMLYNAGCRIH